MSPPFYSLADVQALVAEDAWETGTKSCRDKILSMGLLRADVAKVLQNLTHDDFSKRYGVCFTDFGDIHGDAYVVWIDEVALARCAPYMGMKLYIKFGIDIDEAGHACVLISFHESQSI